MMRVLVVDDHAVVRRGIKQILETEIAASLIEEAQDAHEALEKAQKQTWDLIILDINLPGRSGLDLLPELRYKYPATPVLIMSMYSEDQYALRVLKAGAAGYLNKQSAPEELIKAIKKILGGGRYISDTLADILASRLDDQRQNSAQEILSDREHQIFMQIASGSTISEIAARLSLSVKTVSTYRARLLEKMNLKNNAEIIYYAAHNHLIE